MEGNSSEYLDKENLSSIENGEEIRALIRGAITWRRIINIGWRREDGGKKLYVL